MTDRPITIVSRQRQITKVEAGAAYHILVQHTGARGDPAEKRAFAHHVARGCQEYRFIGSLGFGGKFRNNGRNGVPYVDCYREDETPERLAVIAKVNDLLAGVFGESRRG